MTYSRRERCPLKCSYRAGANEKIVFSARGPFRSLIDSSIHPHSVGRLTGCQPAAVQTVVVSALHTCALPDSDCAVVDYNSEHLWGWRGPELSSSLNSDRCFFNLCATTSATALARSEVLTRITETPSASIPSANRQNSSCSAAKYSLLVPSSPARARLRTSSRKSPAALPAARKCPAACRIRLRSHGRLLYPIVKPLCVAWYLRS